MPIVITSWADGESGIRRDVEGELLEGRGRLYARLCDWNTLSHRLPPHSDIGSLSLSPLSLSDLTISFSLFNLQSLFSLPLGSE